MSAATALVSAHVSNGEPWVGVLGCEFAGWWTYAAVAADHYSAPSLDQPIPRREPRPVWAIADSRFANTSGAASNVRNHGMAGLWLTDCDFTDVAATGAHADVRARRSAIVTREVTARARMRATRCRVAARPWLLATDGAELLCTLTSCEFLDADTLELATNGATIELHGAANVFARSALSISWVFSDILGALRPRAGRAADANPTTTLEVDLSNDTQPVTAAAITPINRILPGLNMAAPRLFQGPWYVSVETTGLDFATGGISPGAIEYVVTGASVMNEVRPFVVDASVTNWREL